MKNKGFIESQKNNKTKKKTKWTKAHTVVFIMIVFFTIGSIFGIYGGISSCKTAKADSNVTVTTYDGSNLFIPVDLYFGDNPTGESTFFLFDVYLITQNNTLSITFNCGNYYSNVYNNYNVFNLKNLYTAENNPELLTIDIVNGTSTSTFPTLNLTWDSDIDYGEIELSYDLSIYDYFYGFHSSSNKIYLSSTNFVSNIYKIDIYGDVLFGTNYCQQTVRYTDVNGEVLKFTFTLNSSYYSELFLDWRTYYLDNTLDNDEIYNQGFNDGRTQGFNDGYHDGVEQGEQNKEQAVEQALQSGYQNGYNQGKTDGIASANDYTFLSLLGAVVDAPLNSITSFFDFNLLGFNMANFFWAIMTCIVILGVIKVIFGRGG